MKRRNSRLAAAMALICLLCCTVRGFAAPAVDLTERGALTIQIKDTETGKGVPGGEVVIYRVAEPEFDPYGGYSYRVTEAFAPGIPDISVLEGMSAAENGEQAALWKAFAEGSRLPPDASAQPDAEGICRFDDLPLGVYLVVQTQVGTGHKVISPFLITIPMYQEADGAWAYQVDAAPKAGTSAPVPTEPSPTVPGTTTPGNPEIPYTGQSWWPVWILSAGGVLLVLAGVAQKRREHGHAA